MAKTKSFIAQLRAAAASGGFALPIRSAPADR